MLKKHRYFDTMYQNNTNVGDKMQGQVIFELKDLSYKELLEVYKEIDEFITFIETVEEDMKEKKEAKGKGEKNV